MLNLTEIVQDKSNYYFWQYLSELTSNYNDLKLTVLIWIQNY